MSPYKLVIFDFDGTLADSAPWFISTLGGLAQRHGFQSVGPDEIETLRGKSNRDIIKHLGIRFWQMPGIARDFRQKSAEAAGDIPLFPGIAQMLERLNSTGVELAIVSSNGEDTIRRVLGPSGRLIDHWACGVSLFGKSAKFRTLSRKLRIDAREILSVGDEGRDVEAAQRAGFASVAVTWGYANEEALRRSAPTFTVRTIEELFAVSTGSFQKARGV